MIDLHMHAFLFINTDLVLIAIFLKIHVAALQLNRLYSHNVLLE